MSLAFVPGVELSRRLYFDAVHPLLLTSHPRLSHSACLIGAGSEVLGFDTVRSTDHDWGPRLQLFLSAADLAEHGDAVSSLLASRLPDEIAGYPIGRGVVVASPAKWLAGRLGFDPLNGVTTRNWLDTPTQALAEVTGGAVHHDGLGVLHPVREALRWYPDDLWRYVLACQWNRIGQEEAFAGRCGEVGDELGSAVVAARLVRDMMRLCLLMARRYPPYSKWLGSAFARLPESGALTPSLTAALAATDWHERERHLVSAYETVAALHNALGLTAPLDPQVRHYFDRPFLVLGAGRFAEALLGGRDLPLTGAIDQFVDSTAVLSDRAVTVELRHDGGRTRGHQSDVDPVFSPAPIVESR